MNLKKVFWHLVDTIRDLTKKKTRKPKRKTKKKPVASRSSVKSPRTKEYKKMRPRKKQTAKLIAILFILSLFGSCCKKKRYYTRTTVDFIVYKPITDRVI